MPQDTSGNRSVGILILVPGINGDGGAWLRGQTVWTRFADEKHLTLVAPAFHTTPEEIHSRKGYYYPELWSGKATCEALEKIARQERIQVERVLLFGFSAGAHFAHRFALWKPERVRAFAAHSAGWWDKPTAALRGVPALIMCGEADERLEATRAFMAEGQKLQLPWIWRSYARVGHEITPQVVRMAQAFLAHYTTAQPGAPSPFVGDSQTCDYFAADSEQASRVPDELRVGLPSRAIAEVWKQEK